MRLPGGVDFIRQPGGGRSFKVERMARESHRGENDPFTAFLAAPPLFSSPSPLPIPKLPPRRLSQFKRKFFFLESFINFRSACTES